MVSMDMNSSHTEGKLKTTTLSEQTLKQLFSCSLSALKRKKEQKQIPKKPQTHKPTNHKT